MTQPQAKECKKCRESPAIHLSQGAWLQGHLDPQGFVKGGTRLIWGCSNWELIKVRKELSKELSEKHSHLKKKDLKKLLNIELNKVRNVGLFEGQNNMGKILMICRDCLQNGTEPQIDLNLLASKGIYILGEKIL